MSPRHPLAAEVIDEIHQELGSLKKQRLYDKLAV